MYSFCYTKQVFVRLSRFVHRLGHVLFNVNIDIQWNPFLAWSIDIVVAVDGLCRYSLHALSLDFTVAVVVIDIDIE